MKSTVAPLGVAIVDPHLDLQRVALGDLVTRKIMKFVVGPDGIER